MIPRFLSTRALAALVIAGAATTTSISAALAQDTPALQSLRVQWVETLPEDSIIVPHIVFATHDGQIDFYDHDRPAPDLLSDILRRLNEGEGTPILLPDLESQYEGTRFAALHSFPFYGGEIGTPPPYWAAYQRARLSVSPQTNRYLSFLVRIAPSDDAFIANEDPFDIDLFDADGRFKGPFYIDLYGHQVMDAGLCANLEENLFALDRWEPIEDGLDCAEGEGTVLVHPGFNSSLRNPGGSPQRILGATVEHPEGMIHHYGDVDADFSQPGYRIGRLVITRGGIDDYAPTGSWYSPDHDGEGFNIELVAPEPGDHRPRLYVHWYTYTPDGGGEQAWLTGIAPVEDNTGLAPDQEPVWIDLLQTHGGRFASDDNPDTVERLPWGRIGLSFSSCTEGHVIYEPDDDAWPSGDYPIHRLSPSIEGLGWLCRPEDALLELPENP